MWELCVASAACLVAAVLAVRLVRAQRAAARALAERGWLLERERESAARQAVDAERARIARELHDIVSHNVSVMLVQAGAARLIVETEPTQAAEALREVETAGRDTMTELRNLLGLLAPPADGSEPDGLAPQPGLARLSPLIDRIAFAGLPVEVLVSGDPRPLPSGVDLTAYRIIQEALTNALRHGNGGKAEVTVRYTDHYLRVEVVNTGPSVLTGGPSTTQTHREGRGLLGLRERVAAFGGDLDARRRLGGGFRVRARIPLERP
ncbi:sensor histidine kinase [Actinokineospora enzanensis]|uniref:sensor histidine kinase n=1 Tax=Actinokineospora enzanensis TaxID=155975 RepID=UPI000367B1A6|nr:sensor histidine kinase [Actinokineospora enzanensis]